MRILIKIAGDIITKSHNVRARFQNQLYQNCRHAFELCSIEASIEKGWGRFYVETEDERVLEILPRIYGIYSFQIVEKILAADIDILKDYCKAHYSEATKGKRFAVRCKRQGKQHFSSQELCSELGAAINHHMEGTVDLKNPEWVLSVDIQDETASISSSVPALGPGGLPLKTAGKALCLMSGGFDSPLAAWMMQKRGVELVYVFFNLAGRAHERSVIEVLKKMTDNWSYGCKPVLYVLDFSSISSEIKQKVAPQYAQVVLKRIFYKTAEKIADTLGLDGIVTGEAIGQVSSQTLRNLHAIEQGCAYPVLRPLIAYDKHDIMELCKKIGTYELSASIKEVCQLVPEKPVVSADINKLNQQQSLISDDLIEKALTNYKMIELRNLQPYDLMEDYLFVSSISESSTLIDCRSKKEYDEEHTPGAVHISYDDFIFDQQTINRYFEKDKKYVIYCQSGIMSAFFAEKLQLKGVDAYCLKS